jgi:histidyl-tRNA synthetase
MRYADNLKCNYVLILGENEIDRGVITMRDMAAKTQHELPLDVNKIIEVLGNKFSG